MVNAVCLLIGWVLDLIFGDPSKLPHPVVWFGKLIAAGEHRLNKGSHRRLKGALLAIGLILFIFALAWLLRTVLGIFALFIYDGSNIHQIPLLLYLFDILAIFYCLAGTTLIREVREVFLALDRSLEEGRQQVARIVALRPGSAHSSPRNTCGEPQRWCHRSFILVASTWYSRHARL